MEIQDLILLVTDVLIVVSVVYCFACYKKLSRELKAFSWFSLLSLVVQFTAQYLSFSQTPNLFLLHVYVPLGFVSITFFYQRVFVEFINQKILWWIMALFLVFSLINTLFLQDIHAFNSFALSLESLLIIIYALSLYTFILNPLVREQKERMIPTWMWINTGLFLYYTTGLLLFYFGELLTSFTTIKFRISWFFHSIIYMVQFICILIGLWKHHKRLTF